MIVALIYITDLYILSVIDLYKNNVWNHLISFEKKVLKNIIFVGHTFSGYFF